MSYYCVFCEIVARKSPANIRYENEDVIAFDNILRWAPVMLLVAPKKHLEQETMWQDEAIMGKVAKVAAEMGLKHCPGGFRLLSNIGHDAMQSQGHGHLHVLGGMFLGHYL